MIQITKTQLPEPIAKQIRDWLNLPARRLFQMHIADLAAAYTADAGNKRVSPETHENSDAEGCADEARKLLMANNVIDSIRTEGYSYQKCEFNPKLVD